MKVRWMGGRGLHTTRSIAQTFLRAAFAFSLNNSVVILLACKLKSSHECRGMQTLRAFKFVRFFLFNFLLKYSSTLRWRQYEHFPIYCEESSAGHISIFQSILARRTCTQESQE